MGEFNESEIIQGIKDMNMESFQKLMTHYGKLVYYVASKILNEPYEKESIEECYNDVFMTIWSNIDCFDYNKGNFKAWLISITKYKALNIKRKSLRENNVLEYMDEITSIYNDDLERIENKELINELLDNLEEKDKIIFLKRYLEGVPIKEIGKELGYSEEYIYTRISRAKKKIKRIVGDYNG
ncbi:sigma-70 family RNA polymerase sigma factor [Clostridium paridis]|uniref:Sigma-70 family RNA polymerase sigma factor n=1 Tax=Clostridium paridis TaxID=2803863 RepID=A0A937K3N5_9CLOT|nr:sigma-70 family RNA polymerase sigma factor [Clostridium paridis]MBL4931812.1 sigma-70 family RNA polymerase sigma factor [Clostridium paridis]